MYDFSGLWYCVYRLGGMLALPAIALQTCQLDHLAAADILPQDMQAGALYRVWYEARTDIIVKCEEVK